MHFRHQYKEIRNIHIFSHTRPNTTGNAHITLRCILVTNVAMENQYVLNIMTVCLYSWLVMQHKKEMPCIMLSLQPVWLYHIFPHYFINSKIF